MLLTVVLSNLSLSFLLVVREDDKQLAFGKVYFYFNSHFMTVVKTFI